MAAPRSVAEEEAGALAWRIAAIAAPAEDEAHSAALQAQLEVSWDHEPGAARRIRSRQRRQQEEQQQPTLGLSPALSPSIVRSVSKASGGLATVLEFELGGG
jgi:hypothetical protein